MSQCHDIYDAPTPSSRAPSQVAGVQCHDAYPPLPNRPRRDPVHACRITDDDRATMQVVRVAGRVDWATQRSLVEHLRAEAPGVDVVIDLSEASTDSAGTGALVACVMQARERGSRVLLVTSDQIQLDVLASIGLDRVAPVLPSVDDAELWFASHE